jgi:hypothetical protein
MHVGGDGLRPGNRLSIEDSSKTEDQQKADVFG